MVNCRFSSVMFLPETVQFIYSFLLVTTANKLQIMSKYKSMLYQCICEVRIGALDDGASTVGCECLEVNFVGRLFAVLVGSFTVQRLSSLVWLKCVHLLKWHLCADFNTGHFSNSRIQLRPASSLQDDNLPPLRESPDNLSEAAAWKVPVQLATPPKGAERLYYALMQPMVDHCRPHGYDRWKARSVIARS